jgi:pilus assembly protein Flp/PilA
MSGLLRQFLADEDGATAIEYGFISLILATGIVTSLTTLKGALNNVFTNLGNTLN